MHFIFFLNGQLDLVAVFKIPIFHLNHNPTGQVIQSKNNLFFHFVFLEEDTNNNGSIEPFLNYWNTLRF